MDKINILQFPIAATKGGITQYVLNTWRNIDKRYFHFDFLTFARKLDFEYDNEFAGSRIIHLPCYPEHDISVFRDSFTKVLEANNYNVIELHTSYWKSTIMEEIARKCGVPRIIIHAHSADIVPKKEGDEYEDALKRHIRIRDTIDESIADAYIACSVEAASWLYGKSIPNDRIIILGNSIDVSRFGFNYNIRSITRKRYGLNGKYVIGYVGRLEPEKNPFFLLKLFKEVQKKVGNAVLLVVGDGSLRESLVNRTIQEGINNVIFTGYIKETEVLLQAMDFFVFPSEKEGYGLALLEAQCSGLPCIGSDGVPNEVFCTKDSIRLSLREERRWIDQIIMYRKDYNRVSNENILLSQGKDMRSQINKLAAIYSNNEYVY